MATAVIAVVAALTACSTYDPIDELTYREFPDTAAAIRAILADGRPRVYAIGEYHPTEQMRERHTPLERFSNEILPLLDNVEHLVVESWFDPSCAAGGDLVASQIQAATARPPTQRTDLARLLATSHVPTHGLPMTCIEHSSLLDPRGRVDFYRLLAVVTAKLLETTLQFVDQGRDVVVYGGALHNDLYPRWPLDDLAYGHTLARILDARAADPRRPSVVEIDLVAPEIVAPIKSLWREDWFPLLARAAPDRVLVWERGIASYVVILPADG